MADQAKQTQVPAPAAAAKPEAKPSSSLIDEIIEITEEHQRLGLGTLDSLYGDERAVARATGLDTLRRSAIKETEPIQWTLFQDTDGHQWGRPTLAAALVIGSYFGVHEFPDGPPVIIEDKISGKRYAEVTGSARSTTTGKQITNIRAKRFEHEDFIGRVERPGRDDQQRRVGVNVGLEDLKDSARSLFTTKCVMHLSGIIKVSVARLAEIWGRTDEWVVKECSRGHGFRDKRAAAQDTAPTADGKIPRKYVSVLWAKTYERAGAIGVNRDDVVAKMVKPICHSVFGGAEFMDCPADKFDAMKTAIDGFKLADDSDIAPFMGDKVRDTKNGSR